MRNAIQRLALLPIVALFLLPAACHRTDGRAEALLNNADSLLTANPDSALRLLEALPATTELTRRESARYALLLAQATDKCEKPLLPCDSLLDVALDYYDDDERERAVALLYKGRLEVEMEQSERAIGFLLEGLEIIKKFPQEIETRKYLFSSLGNEYFDARLYEKAGKAYQELYKCCTTDKDKSIALNSLASFYAVTEKEDSALILQCKALEYAQISKDSAMIATTALNLSVEYSSKEANDTALYYARMSLQWLPGNKNRSDYHANIGNIFLDKEERDSAIYYINKKIEDSTNIKGRANALLNLSYIKEEQGDYQATTELLYQFVDIIDSIYFTEQSNKIQQLIHKYDSQTKVKEEQFKGQKKLRTAIACFTFCCFLIALFYQHRINKRKRLQLINEQNLKQAQEKLTSLETTIEESHRIVVLLQREHSTLIQEKEKNNQEIQERENQIKKLKEEKLALRNWLFKQSDIYKKIIKLSKQNVSSKKERSVLTDAELKKLKETVLDIYTDYIAGIKAQYPKLTDEDLLFLCLDEIGFSSQTISLCFGNIDTHALAQRKYRMKKERM